MDDHLGGNESIECAGNTRLDNSVICSKHGFIHFHVRGVKWSAVVDGTMVYASRY